MHELGIVVKTVEQLEKVAAENNVNKVTLVRMEIGEVSSVVPELFTDAFEWAKKRSEYLKDARLEIIILKGLSYCRSCGNTYSTTEYAKKCPECGSSDTYLVTGSEINIKDIRVE